MIFARTFLLSLIAALMLSATASAARIKDITTVDGNRDNQLVGYGLVVGLAGNGDSKLNYTTQSIANMLQRFGVNIDATQVKSKNVAAVMVTADIPPNARSGARIDVTVSAAGDATTLQGGVLLQTPLYGADGKVYAVAQGQLAVGGFIGGQGGAGGATVQQNFPTVGTIAAGAIVEREIQGQILSDGCINLLLLNPDFTTAVRIADAVNDKYPGSAQAENFSRVNIRVPVEFEGQTTNFVAHVGLIDVMPDLVARVIINERTGTIVATSNVRISTVAVSHGSLTIAIASSLSASQPNAFAGGETAILPSTDTQVSEQRGKFMVVEDFPTIERLTAALNAMGVTTREMMSILQSIKSAGALQAELEMR